MEKKPMKTMNEKLKQKLPPLLLTLLVIVADQVTKAIVVAKIPRLSLYDSENSIIPILGNYVRFIHVRNKAVAFSMGSNLPDNLRQIFFAILPLLLIIAMFVIYFRNNEFTALQRWSLCGILGGGLGNLIDRFFRPDGVVDFIDCYFWGLFGMERWPTFNVADSAVVVCGILLVISFVKQMIKDSKKEKSNG